MKRFIYALAIVSVGVFTSMAQANDFKPIIKSTDSTYHVVYTQAQIDADIAVTSQTATNVDVEEAYLDEQIAIMQARKTVLGTLRTELKNYFDSMNGLKKQVIVVVP